MTKRFLHLPKEVIAEQGAPICEGGTDLLIKKLLDRGHTGYLRIEADPYLGFALFKNGEIREGYLLKDGIIVSTSVKALIDFRLLCEREGKVTIVSLGEDFFDAARITHCGNELIAPTDASVVNFNAIFSNYKDKVKNGLLVLNGADGKIALIRIENSKWKLNMRKEEFDKIFKSPGSVVALYEIDPESLENPDESDEVISRDALIKRELIIMLKKKYGDDIAPQIEKISHEADIEDNLDKVLSEVEEFIRFFIDDKGVKEFMGKVKNKLQKL